MEQEVQRILDEFPEMKEDKVDKIVRELTDVVNPRFVSKDWAARVPYSRDQTGGGAEKVTEFRVPDIVVIPDSSQDVSYTCEVAQRHGVPVLPVSTGANVCGCAVPIFRGIMIDFKRMNRILEIDEDGLTITVEPYVNYGRVQAELEPRGLRINVPGAPNSASVLANNFFVGDKFYSSKFGYGPMEVVGAEIVLPNGKIIKTGTLAIDPIDEIPEYVPGKQMKATTKRGRVAVQAWGPDMTGLPYQSCGGNGIVTKLTIKIYRIPKKSKILMYGFDNLLDLTQTLAEICGRDIGYGGIASGPMYSIPTLMHSKNDTKRLMKMFRNNGEAIKNSIRAFIKSPLSILNKSYREILSGMLGIRGRDFTIQVFLFGTERKVKYDFKYVTEKIIGNKKFNSKKPGNGNGFAKHIFWKYHEDAKPEIVYKIFRDMGLKDIRQDWLLRFGKTFDYNEAPTRIMRKAAGFILQSPRMPFGKMHWSFDIFMNALREAGYEGVDEGNWSTYINSGSGAHYACLEFDMIYDPKSQEEKDKIMSILNKVILELYGKGIYFPVNYRILRDQIEQMVMPKLWALTKEIRSAIQATVLGPH